MIELLACCEGLEMATRLWIPKIILITDYSSVVELWKDEKEQIIAREHIGNEMQDMCKSFQEVKILYIGQPDANNAACRCEKEAFILVNFI
jgi:hypothetical protein